MRPQHEYPDLKAARLEQRITQLLREQPLRRAPKTLALRVLAQIERRQRSLFQRWPLAVRVGFVVLAGLTAQLTAELTVLLARMLDTGSAAPRPQLAVLAETALAMSRHLPAVWLYAGLAVLILVYGGMFGIGIAMYRTANPHPVSQS